MPDAFQRALLISGQPPFAELHLQQESGEPNQQADRISAIRSQIKTYREIDERSYDGLGDIVRQAHFAIETQASDGVAELFVLVEKYERGYQDECKGKFLPHIEHCACRLLYDGIVLHDKFLQRVQRSKCDGSHNQCFRPEAEILLGRNEKLFTPDVEAQEEQSRRLEETSGIHRPQQTCLLSQRDVAHEEFPPVSQFWYIPPLPHTWCLL